MKHRGTARKRLLLVAGDARPWRRGVEHRAGGLDIGEIVSVHSRRGFALVRLDRLEEPRVRSVDGGRRIA